MSKTPTFTPRGRSAEALIAAASAQPAAPKQKRKSNNVYRRFYPLVRAKILDSPDPWTTRALAIWLVGQKEWRPCKPGDAEFSQLEQGLGRYRRKEIARRERERLSS